METVVMLHYGDHWASAKWIWRHGSDGRMIVGDGFGTHPEQYLGNFASSLDMISHELVHGITNATAQLIYRGQSGALNESISDVFASMVKQYTLNQRADEADWLIGQDVFLPEYPDMALRSLKEPGNAFKITHDLSGKPQNGLKDEQVWQMKNCPSTFNSQSESGLHICSVIPNHAFYIAATNAGSYCWTGIGRVWYETLTRGEIGPSCSFTEFATATVKIASGFQDDLCEAIRSGWDTVGVPYQLP